PGPGSEEPLGTHSAPDPDTVSGTAKPAVPGVDAWETTNLLCVARVLTAAALEREETRGCHWREDRPDRDDRAWHRHLVIRLAPDRTLVVHRTESTAFPPTSSREHQP
ncbi:L-aspartate oxidase, partial [Streptomyces sp. SID5473]|nr:L-aspartate oxidase [Streptomyces tsukubensis NRRL18488]MYS66075.1 L-aspartate oxidase [Streptomyces sp. SID5473]